MTTGKLLATLAAVILTAGMVMASNTTATSKPSSTTNTTRTATHHLMGTISSVSAADLVVSHQYKGKEENSTFVLNSATKKEGNLAKGDETTVYYQLKNKERIATDVKINGQPKKS